MHQPTVRGVFELGELGDLAGNYPMQSSSETLAFRLEMFVFLIIS